MNKLRQTVEALLGYLDGYDRDYPEAAPVFDAVREALLMEVTPAQMAHAAALRRENEWLKDDLHDAARFALSEYERGFVDGMSEQAKRSVDKAVNRMAEPRPIQECYGDCPTNPQTCPNPCNFEGRPKPEQKGWFTVEELNNFATKLKEKAWKA